MQNFYSTYQCVLMKLLLTRVYLNLKGADLQTKPDSKVTQPVNMVQLLTVRKNYMKWYKLQLGFHCWHITFALVLCLCVFNRNILLYGKAFWHSRMTRLQSSYILSVEIKLWLIDLCPCKKGAHC